jgi:hypothetical protein
MDDKELVIPLDKLPEKFTSSIIMKPKIDFEKGTIEIDNKEMFGNMIIRHYKDIINTKEQIIRDSLIVLGWTPPK